MLEISDERDIWARRLIAAQREAYAAGYMAGCADTARSISRAWAQAPLSRLPDGPTHAELERRRYGPGGRESWLLPDSESPNAPARERM